MRAFYLFIAVCLLLSQVAMAGMLSEEAELIALKQVPGDVLNVKKEEDQGIITYEFIIELYDGSLTQVVVSSETGEILDVIELSNYKEEKAARMQAAQEKAIAHVDQLVPGNYQTKLIDSEYKHVGGKLIYEFEIKKRTRSYEVRIDGQTGLITSVREEN